MLPSATAREAASEPVPPSAAHLGPPALTQHVGYLLRRAYALSTDCARACIPDDTALREVAVLALLAERAPISQRALGDLLGVNRSSMVKVVDAMEAKGWMVRERNANDRRAYALRATDGGRRALARRLRDLETGDDRLTARLTARERRSLNRALGDLLEGRDQAPIASLATHSGYLIAQAHHQLRQRAVELLAPLGLDPRDFGVLAVLAGQRPCSQNQLAGHLGVSPPGALGFVEELEARGLVSRERSETDRRVYDVRLTNQGDQLLHQARAAVADLERDLSIRLHDRLDELHTLLLKLLAPLPPS